jgi:hypothetical protein
MKAMGVSGPYHVTGTNFPIALLLGGKGLSKDQPPPHPLEPFRGREAVQAIRQINTGGGAYIEGNVDTGGGDFTGRDKIARDT